MTTESPDNERLYRLHCGTCPQWDGSGVPGMYPDLRNSKIVNENMESLIKLVLLGVTEETRNREEKYSGEMPPLDYLSDEDILLILNYIGVLFTSGKHLFTPELVEATRNKTSP